ncbi:MAG: hybrid sensor histidine kinase/response regulator [Symploca sp. SIO1B1]|nr:hybrid sensor histidine kinase/response regulator [Symploca sp. SIO2D2]NER24608.1 hybrid sensor histidine kinase/response regulator [Symploca sp. SIO1C2]NER50487.1 hybrid sensor histidine kinase/response regulator [Symploca sp. SIO1A3]NER96491.1 hybrid sensor histidine kinase/response regulator [Symploca sp. SIO1B1]
MTKILVIEDEELVRENLLDFLEAEDYQTIDACNGKIGVELAQKHLPDLIICDVMMPELDGYGVLEKLSNNSATATIPFIFLTAKADKTDRRDGMNLGADDYLTKPFTIMELKSAIEARLGRQREIKKKFDDLRNSITLALPHEMRTSLNGILGSSQLMMDPDSLDSEEIQEMAETIYNSGKRLLRLTENFLRYTEVEILATDPERIDQLQNSMSSSVEEIITKLTQQVARKRRREADVHAQLQDASVRMSDGRFKTMVEELIDNAFKFSDVGTPVQVVSTVENDTFILSVNDQGRGMTKAQIADLGAYLQFDRKEYEQQGIGLGLVLAKRLAELHGGQLTIESILGEQTTVKVILPLSL